MAKSLNERAVDWWVERFEVTDKREEFQAALRKHLPDHDWYTYSDYDPSPLLLKIIREFMECDGYGVSSYGIVPEKTGLKREGDKLFAREGYGCPWTEVT